VDKIVAAFGSEVIFLKVHGFIPPFSHNQLLTHINVHHGTTNRPDTSFPTRICNFPVEKKTTGQVLAQAERLPSWRIKTAVLTSDSLLHAFGRRRFRRL
jgi:hypothetical protein